MQPNLPSTDCRLQSLLKCRDDYREARKADLFAWRDDLLDEIKRDPEWIEDCIKEQFSRPAVAPSEITLVTVHQLESEPYAHTELKRLGDCMNMSEDTARLTSYISAQQSSSGCPLVWVSAQIDCPTCVILDKSHVTISSTPANDQNKVIIRVSWSLNGPATTPIFV